MQPLGIVLSKFHFNFLVVLVKLCNCLKCSDLELASWSFSWQVISPVDVKGFIEVIDALEHVQDKVYERPTILVSGRVKGEEEIPDGAVAVLTPDMPDVLSHVSVRARNGKVCKTPSLCFKITICGSLTVLGTSY